MQACNLSTACASLALGQHTAVTVRRVLKLRIATQQQTTNLENAHNVTMVTMLMKMVFARSAVSFNTELMVNARTWTIVSLAKVKDK